MKVWFITGTSSGFGYEITKEALANGDYVVATSRNIAKLEELEKEYKGKILPIKMDVTNKQQVNEAVSKAIEWQGKIDVVVNNACLGNFGAVEETSDENYRKLFGVNVFGIVNVLKAVLPILRKQGNGHILNFSSGLGISTFLGVGAYAATKFAVEGLSETLAQEVGSLGIKVTIIEPGGFRTNFMAGILTDDSIADYDKGKEEVMKFMKDFATQAPGNPKKAAKAIYEIVQQENPPLRFPMGSDCLGMFKGKIEALQKQHIENEELSKSTDY